jgi:hypothetical protein
MCSLDFNSGHLPIWPDCRRGDLLLQLEKGVRFIFVSERSRNAASHMFIINQ